MMTNQELEDLHAEWQELAAKNGQLLASKDEIEERMATDARTLADVNLKLQILEREKMRLLPKLADAAMAVHGVSNTGATTPAASRLSTLYHMR
jgi:hypothetical protein